MDYTLVYSKAAMKDIPKLKSARLSDKARVLCESLLQNPTPPFSKKLIGNLEGKYSIRISLQHRLVYEVLEDLKIIRVLRMWGHYDDN